MTEPLAAGYTVRDLCRRYRVGEHKIRTWISRGEIKAINIAANLCGRPRWIIPADALDLFEKRRAGVNPPPPRRRRRRTEAIDFFPDD